MEERLENRTQEPRLEMSYFEEGVKHRIIYYGNLELLRQGAYELFIEIYKTLRRNNTHRL